MSKIKISLSEMSKKLNIQEISDDFKELLCLPRIPKNADFDIKSSSVPLEEYLRIVEEQGKEVSKFFQYEMMRLLIFRHIMCLKSNTMKNFRVVIGSGTGKFLDTSKAETPRIVSRLDYPISVNEKNFCYNPDDDSCRIPKTMIRDWVKSSKAFGNPELYEGINDMIYSVAKDLFIGNGYNSEYEFKNALIEHLRFKGYKYDDFVVGWISSVVEKVRIYINL